MRNIAISFILLLLCPSCYNRYIDGVIEDRIKELEPNTPIVLTNITDFDWDTMHIAGPYTVRKQLNIKAIPQCIQNELDQMNQSDDKCIIIFTYSGRIVKYAKIKRSVWDFSKYSDFYSIGDTIQ